MLRRWRRCRLSPSRHRHRHRHHQSGRADQRRLAGVGHRGRAEGRLQRPREKGPGAAEARPDHLQRADRPGRRASVASAQASLRLAQASFERNKQLVAQNFVSQPGARPVARELDVAQGQPAAGQAQLARAKADLNNSVIRSADRRRHHQAHHRPGPDGGGVVQHAEPVPDRARPDQDADRYQRLRGRRRRAQGRAAGALRGRRLPETASSTPPCASSAWPPTWCRTSSPTTSCSTSTTRTSCSSPA
jgi:hypothetical protein